jgi:non-specific serine/threonine protein kinase
VIAVSARCTGLNDDVTSFVGRRRELAAIKKALSESRLVTLTGVGGVGKTRLALRVADDLQRAFPDGVCLVELADVAEPELLGNVVAESLRLRDQSARALDEILVDYLKDRHLLLILDNCEHLLDACGTLAAHLLRAAPHLVVLATSREPLGILGEHSWPVPPLSMPDLANVAPSRGGYVYGYEALELFEERARAVQPDFTLDSASKQVAAQLCQRLDGLPLAIELAAVRLRVLSIEQIVARLEDRYRLLSSGNRGGPARHQTLRAAVDWSFDLCSEQEKALWGRLSTFAGGFDLEAVEAVCTDDDIQAEDAFDLVAGLVDKSIILREGGGPRARYRLLEIIRAYGREQLVALDAEGTFRRRHRDYYLRMAELNEDSWFGPDQVQWCDRLESEQANLWSALDYCLTTPGESATGLHLAGALCFYWNACGHLKDGRYWLDKALHAAPNPSRDRTKALWVNGYVAMTQGDNEAAMGYFDECVELAAVLEDETARAFVQQFRGSAEQFKGDFALAESLLSESVALHRASGLVNSLTVLGIAQLGFVSCLLGQAERAIELCEECRVLSSAHGERWALSWALWVCGLARWTQEEFGKAAVELTASLEAKHALNDLLGVSSCVELLAWVAVEEGDLQRACRLFGAGRTLWASIGTPLFGSEAMMGTRARYEDRARRGLGKKAFDHGYRVGEQFKTEEAIAFALGESDERLGFQPPGSPPLTRREEEVARLVAEGLSNREIAEWLVISQRTAEGHVENVLAKLGFKSRTQVAAWFVGRDRAQV